MTQSPKIHMFNGKCCLIMSQGGRFSHFKIYYFTISHIRKKLRKVLQTQFVKHSLLSHAAMKFFMQYLYYLAFFQFFSEHPVRKLLNYFSVLSLKSGNKKILVPMFQNWVSNSTGYCIGTPHQWRIHGDRSKLFLDFLNVH